MTDRERRQHSRRKRQAVLDELLRVGAQMANVCFNCGQSVRHVGPREKDIMAQLRRDWDDALFRYRELLTKTRAKR